MFFVSLNCITASKWISVELKRLTTASLQESMHQNYKILEVFFVTIYMLSVYNFLTIPSFQRIDRLLIISFWK